MKKFSIILCILILCSNITAIAATAPKPPTITAPGSVLMDFNSGQILYDKNSHTRYAPASTTKILTALITLERSKLFDKVVIGKNPPYEDGSKIYLLEGEEVTIEQLLYAMMLESANDAALALAEHISGSKEAFAKLMNEKAAELGCTDTHFVNPNGLYNKNHYTSAHDLATITAKAMENPVFRQIISTVSFKLMPTNKQKQTRFLHNHNKLLSVKSVKYPGADGVKTGYTVKSKHAYVGSATRNGRTLIAVFLYDDATFYKETARLFNYGFNSFTDKKVLSMDKEAAKLNLKGDDEKIPVYPEKDVFITIPKDTNPNIKTNIKLNASLTKVKKGEIVGTVEIICDDAVMTSANLVSGIDHTISKPLLGNVNNSVKGIFRLSNIKYIILLALIAFLARGFYRKYRRLKGINRF